MPETASPVSDELRETLRWATASLRDIYGARLKRLILFGSRARGDATPESDVDVLVVLEGPIRSYEEAKRTSRVATRAAAYRGAVLSFVHMSAEEFADDQRPLVQSVKKEGIRLLDHFSGEASSRLPSPSDTEAGNTETVDAAEEPVSDSRSTRSRSTRECR